MKGLLERNVGHIHAADCNEDQLQLTEKMFSSKVCHNVLFSVIFSVHFVMVWP